jgi:hypothetical protein
MPMMSLNLALLFVFGLSSIQLSFINREDLPHGAAEFGGWLLNLMNRCRHDRTLSSFMPFATSLSFVVEDNHHLDR